MFKAYILALIFISGIVRSKLLDVVANPVQSPAFDPDIKPSRNMFIVRNAGVFLITGVSLAVNDNCFAKYLAVKYPVNNAGAVDYSIGYLDEISGEIHTQQIITEKCRTIKR